MSTRLPRFAALSAAPWSRSAHPPLARDRNPACWVAWPTAASSTRAENTRSGRRCPRLPITAWLVATPARRGLSAGQALPPPWRGHPGSGHPGGQTRPHEPRDSPGSRARPARAIAQEDQRPRPMAARLAVQSHALTKEHEARVMPGFSCARRNRADGWRPEWNVGGGRKAAAIPSSFLHQRC